MPGRTMEIDEPTKDTPLKWRKRAIFAGWLVSGACFSLLALTIPFVIPALRKYCIPYVPATPVQIRTVVSQLKGKSTKVVDLGSGDGRVVRAGCITECVMTREWRSLGVDLKGSI